MLGSLALGLTACVSAKEVNFNSTSPGFYTNHTTTTVIAPNAASSLESVSLVDVIDLESVSGSSSSIEVASNPSFVTVAQQPSSTTTLIAETIAADSSPVGLQTVVITTTVPACAPGSTVTDTSSVSSNVNAQAPFALAASSTLSASYGASTLLPAVHWDYPVDDIHNLAPSNSSNLYYTSGGVSDPSIQHLYASLSTTMMYESVVLDHSSFVANTSCSNDGIMVTFASSEAFNFASSTWSASSSGFVLVTYTDGCHGSSDQQRTFWLVDALETLADSLSILAKVETELAIESALHEVDLQWGTYYPASNSAQNITSGNGSGSASSGSSSGSSNDGTSSSFSGSSQDLSNNNSSLPYSGSTSSSAANNTTTGTTGGSACGNAPSFTIDGLPAANCGDSNFDAELDDAIGYLGFSSVSDDGSSLADFLPDASVDSTDLTDAEDSAQLSKRSVMLEKRRFNLFKAIVHTLVKVTKVVVHVTTAPIRLVATGIRHIPVVGDFIAKQTELDPSISGSKDFNFGPDATADSPWGKAAEIYSKSKTSASGNASADATIYCVDCGVKGHVAMAGQAKFNVLDGLHGLTANLNANLEAGVNLGLVAHAQYADTKTKALIRAPLPEVGVAVKGVFSAGVYLSVDAVSTVDVSAEGEALVGVVMTIPNFQATLDLFNQDGASKSGVTGFTPTFEKRFEASGKVAASVKLALPIAINCGFEIPAISLKRAISLIEQPSLYGNLTVAASTANVAPASDTCNNGIEYFANLQNDVNFDFLGLKTFTLNHYDSPPLLQGCKTFGPSTPATSDNVSATTDNASATTDNTSATTDSASATTDNASTTTNDTSATTDNASTPTDNASATTNNASATTDNASATTDDASATTDNASATTDNASITTGDASITTGDASITTGVAAPTADAETPSNQSSTPTPTEDSISNPTTTPEVSTAANERRRSVFFRRDNSTMPASDDDDEVMADDTEDTFDDTDNADETDDVVSDDSSTADGAEFEDDTTDALALSADQQSEDGITFNTLIDIQNTFQVVPGTDGNLYTSSLVPGSPSDAGLFAESQNIIVGDDEERVLHYYPDEMATYNVSRIRLSLGSDVPKTADAIALSPIDYDDANDTPSVYFAVSTKQDVYSLVLCDFSNGADSKIFIINDQSGLDSLQNNTNIKYTVTGAPVQACYPLAIISGGNGTVSS
ncbi:hypothetical protein KCU71_g1370, partial [Aureobasidium melanogenum]